MRKLLLLAGVLGPTTFVVVFLVLGATRPGYDPVWTFVSQLSLDGGGEWQVANFIVSGLLIVAFGLELRRRFGARSSWEWAWITVIGLGLIALGIFCDDPWLGYPPPDAPSEIGLPVSWHGLGHVASGVFTFLGLTGAPLTWARQFARENRRWWYRYSVVSAILFPVIYVAAVASGIASEVPESPLAGYAGLLQRLALGTALAWVFLLAVRHPWSTPTDPG